MIPLKSFLVLVFVNSVICFENDTGVAYTHDKSEILSRKKRFLVFPEGSSFQLVFCTTYPAIFKISDIFLWGVTAALAWELPQDPYSPFDHKADPLHRRMDTKMVKYYDENGKIVYKRPYSIRKLIVNPAFAKRSVDGSAHTEIKKEYKIDRKQMHASKNKREFLSGEFLNGRQDFHRSTRASLYQKIETMFQGLGNNGKECMLKTLCIVGKTRDDPQGSFLQELLRATFTLPQGVSNDDLEDYDKAFSATGSCDELYPECVQSSAEPMLY